MVNNTVELNDAFEVDGKPLDDDEKDPIVLNQIMGAAEEVRNAPKVRIVMHNQDSDDKPVFVAVNGMGYSIPREIPVVIPRPILVALENAVETKYYREERDGKPFGPILERHIRRFPFSVTG